ncbi:MAG: ATP-binding protein [Phycisphaerae bacterium]|jgi:signal transduction histidine kinase/CheY-like chemotaxis protein
MLVTFVVGAAAAFQYVAVVLALRVLRLTGRSLAWGLITIVALLMALRRSLVLYRLLSGDGTYAADPVGELDALASSVFMAIGVACFHPFLLTMRRTEQELRERGQTLAKRVTELNCLYAVSTLVEQRGTSLHEILGEVPALLVAPLQHPEIAAARITVGDNVFQTDNFTDTTRRLDCPIGAPSQPLGRIEVCYVAAPPGGDEQLFPPEERSLVKAIAERLRRVIERLRGEAEKAVLQQELHQTQKLEALGQLAAGVAHDVNNLTTVVLGHVNVARAQVNADHPAATSLGTIERAALEAGELTESLLKFAGRAPAQKRPVDVCAAVQEGGRLLRHILPASIDLRVDAPTNTPLWASADPTQLQQVILNLAINARDAMPGGGRLSFSVFGEERPGEGGAEPTPLVGLRVADTGTGIAPELLPRLFDPFFTTKPRGQGTGLGLSIVHGIVEDHGGTVDIASEPGRGATFTVRLPRLAPQEAVAPEEPPQPVPTGDGELIVVAEHHQLVRELLVSSLQSLGYRTIAATNGPETLSAWQQARAQVRLLIVGADLPGRDGLECLQAIRAAGADTTAILITGRADRELEDRLDEHTILLCKPFNMDTLGRVVHEALEADDTAEPRA